MDLWQRIDEKKLLESVNDLYIFKRLEERGYGDILLARYPSLRKYFPEFLHLAFQIKPGTEPLLKSIQLIRQLQVCLRFRERFWDIPVHQNRLDL
ncbi:MAG: hypothetical protein KZQ60_16910 [Candidatus Thiodiazotropha sp. (ex Lucinoma aequizonata)]|nr:hypothetical protein [Candidatus Thiodiazotropha sp. (ex Lucinoma aequizonata)]MCU7911280.1 hypothetical protein [Candidatus Thiodiazotropha sp. (ex Lucinoma aequizonata)]